MTGIESRQAAAAERHPPLRVGDLTVDLERRSVRRGAEPIDLPDRSFRLLEALIRKAPEEVGKDRLIAEVWDDAVVSDETLAQRVRLLRQSLGDDSQNPRYIASVRGRGYRLVATVSDAASSPERRRPLWLWLAAAAAVAALVVGGSIVIQPILNAGIDERRDEVDVLAVLPFTDLGGEEEHRFLADGMHEELLNQLAEIAGLAVVSRTSVERYRGSDLALPAIADELGADAVIEGSVRVDGDRLRVAVQLIDASSDAHLWASNFDRRLSVQDIFEMQADVASQIAEALRLEYSTTSRREIELPTDSLEAYRLYLLGRFHRERLDSGDLEKAIDFFEQAIDIDPEFAAAWAELGWVYSFLGTTYGSLPPAEAYPKAREAALRAMSLDTGLSDARTLYADILTWYDWDFDAAEREYEKSLELDPLNLSYSLFLSTQARHDEAIAMIERLVVARPYDPWLRINAGWRYLNAGMSDKAIESALSARDHRDSYSVLGSARLAQGDTAAAIEVFEDAVANQGRSVENVANLARAYFLHGRRDDAERLLEELLADAEDGDVPPTLLASVYFAAGNADRGFALLERAYEQRSRYMIFLKVSTYLDGYRDDPRYRSLLERVGLPD